MLGKRLVQLLAIGLLWTASVLRAEEEEAKPEIEWKGTSSLGYTLTGGNSRTQAAIGSLDIGRESPLMSMAWKAGGNYGTTRYTAKDIETVNNFFAAYNVNLFLSEAKKTYGVLRARHQGDHFQGYWGKTLLEAGAGYSWLGTEKPVLKTEIGYAYIYWQYVQPNADGDDKEGTSNGVARLEFAWDITEGVELTEEANYYVDFDDSQAYETESVTKLSVKISDRLALQSALTLKYLNLTPLVPERDALGAGVVDDAGDAVLIPAKRLDTIWTTAIVLTLM